jgi:hypothetical protein
MIFVNHEKKMFTEKKMVTFWGIFGAFGANRIFSQINIYTEQ